MDMFRSLLYKGIAILSFIGALFFLILGSKLIPLIFAIIGVVMWYKGNVERDYARYEQGVRRDARSQMFRDHIYEDEYNKFR